MSLLGHIQFGPQFLVGNRRLFLFCLLLFLLSGALSFWFFFPAEVLQRYLVQEVSRETGLSMVGSEAEILFPAGLELDLQVDSGQPELVPILLCDLQLTPVWTRLLTGTTAVDMQAVLAGGTVEGQANRSGRLQLEFTDVELFDLQQVDIPYRLQGKLKGALQIADMAAALNGQGSFNLQLRESFLHGLSRIGLPDRLALGLLQLEGKFNQQRISVEKVLLTEGTIEMSGGGTLLIGETPEQTRMNLNLRIHPLQSTPDSVREALNLTGVKPTADGSYLLRIAGTLARPVLR